MDTVKLREYLGKAFRLEKDIYTMNETINKLNSSKRAPVEKRVFSMCNSALGHKLFYF